MKDKIIQLKKRHWICFLFMTAIAFNLSAQNLITIKGKVIDATLKEGIIGANVIVKGTTNGTITDYDGNYSIEAPNNGTLVFSYIGMETQEVPIQGKKTINVTLSESAVALKEVVAIGYGSVKKSDATGSVTAIKADEISRGVATSPQDLLQGKTPGVVVTSGGGAPGSGATIRIRGGSSLTASNDPLVVIDGVPVDNSGISGMSNPLSTIHPNDIESFTVLKDASATAIYGSRASNGVILITTKRGGSGLQGGQKARVSYDGNIRVNTHTKSVDVLSADQFREAVNQYWGNIPAATALLGSENTDWQKEIFRTSISTDHNLSVSGLLGSVPYRVSGAFTSDNGILKTSGMDRSTLSLAATPTLFDQHLRINLNAKGMYIKNRFADTGAIGSAVSFDPTQPVYSDNLGSGIGNGYFSWVKKDPNGDYLFNDIAAINPLALLKQKKDGSEAYRSLGNAQFDYKVHFFPDLKLNLNLGYDVSKSDGSTYIYDNSPMSYKENDKVGVGQRARYSQYKYNLLLDFFGNYVKEIKSIHSKFDAMLGYSWQHFYRSEKNNTITNLGKETYRSDFKTENYLVSFFGRLNYTFMDRYLLTATVRNDNSSRFSKDTRSGVFPSFAFAWRMTEEPWLKNQNILSDLKLRLGYGVTGQQDIYSDYPYIPTYTGELGYAEYPMGSIGYVKPLRPDGYDSKIKWEETQTYNIGIDYGFLDQRISGTIDYYYRDTKDLLNKIPVPAGSNLTNEIITNVGSMKNKGIEFSINTKPIVSNDLNWDLGFNITYNTNEITKLNLSNNPNYFVATGGIAGPTGQTIQAHKVGYPAYSFYVFEQVYDKAGKPLEGVYVDQNRDGVIDDNDKIIYHNPAPKVSMGITSKLLYKNWDFSFSLRANVGNYVYDNLEAGNTNFKGLYNPNGSLSNMLARGTYFESPQYQSSYYIRNASFLRCDNITLGYSFEKLKLGQLRVYSTVQNPFVITKYKGLDPEVYGGIDNNVYPRPFSVMLGASFSF